MKPESVAAPDILNPEDQNELTKLINVLELSEGAATIFAIAPDCSAKHPVVERLKSLLPDIDESFQLQNFFYSDRDFYTFLHSLDKADAAHPEVNRRLVMAFGLDQLDLPRLKREMKQLNLGREAIFEHNLVLMFWLNRTDFLDEFRRRAPDFWDWRGKVAIFKTHPPIDPLFYPYLERLISENSHLKMSGIMQVQRQVDLFLDQIYVSLQAELRQEITETVNVEQEQSMELALQAGKVSGPGPDADDFDQPSYAKSSQIIADIAVSTKTVTERVDLADAIRRNQYSVILGDPGAGKTTLLRYLALNFAQALQKEAGIVRGGEAEELGLPLLPVFFRIAEYSEQLARQPELSLLEFLGQFYQQFQPEEASKEQGLQDLLCEQLRQGRCLVLIDGLDEVFDQASRKLIVERIEEFISTHSSNKFVITSRIAGYKDANLSSRFAHFTITAMSSEQVEKFLGRWCLAIEQAQQPENNPEFIQQRAEEETQGILQAIKDNEGVKRLTKNPLLLTILALIHRNGERLPNRRVKLYELAVQTLTEDWQLHRGLPEAVILTEGEVVEMLAPLAYWMHETKPSGLVEQAEVEEKLAETLAELTGEEPESNSVQQAVAQFLRKVRETTGLFVERAPGLYGFMHLTFEEYFAARHIADNDRKEVLRIIRHHLHEPRWEEPILLTLGYYGVHFAGQANRLVQQLFHDLEDYRPAIDRGEIQLRNTEADKPVLVWPELAEDGTVSIRESDTVLKELMLAGRVISEVTVSASTRLGVIKKLLLTSFGIDGDVENDTIKNLLRTLRQIEQFNQKGEVVTQLKQFSSNLSLSEEIRAKAKAVILYIVCGNPGEILVKQTLEILNRLDPTLLVTIEEMVAELGEEMTSALESSRQEKIRNLDAQSALDFLSAMSYMRTDNHKKAISLLEELRNKSESNLKPYVDWALAACYKAEDKLDQALDFYQECFEQLSIIIEPNALGPLWKNRGICYRSHAKYEQAVECELKDLEIRQKLDDQVNIADAEYQLGRIYQDWGKYEEAIAHYQQSRELYEQLGREQNVANQWYRLGDCYRAWSRYEEAIEHQKQCLSIRRKLDDQTGVASAYWQLGSIYQDWRKYEEAISFYQQSRNLYERLEIEKDVALKTWWIADAYKEWEKYEKAISYYQKSLELYKRLNLEKDLSSVLDHTGDCYRDWGQHRKAIEYEQQCLEIRKRLEDKSLIANTYYKLGRTYQAWEKYEDAIAYYRQSHALYDQLGSEKSVAARWYNLAACYRDWGKYGQAVECHQQCLTVRQKLDDLSLIAVTYYQLGRTYQAWGRYEEAIAHHQQSRELYKQLGNEKSVAAQWYSLAECYREWDKYEQAIECEHKDLELCQKLDDQSEVALAYYQFGRIYQAWSKYEEAIAHYQQSRDLYDQLGSEKSVAARWFNLAECYRDWGKYEQAVECHQRCLTIRQKLDDQSLIAGTYFQLGRTYQAWGKYEEALAHHQQSRDFYNQLGNEKSVAAQWYKLAECYRDWSKYEQAVECHQQCLTVRQKLDDKSLIAVTYYQLGRTYQAWNKYEEAVTNYQQSHELYEQLGLEKDVANLWYWLGNCYRVWSKYEQALEHQQQCLAIRQKLDDQTGIASAYSRLGFIYQDWSKYEEAITHYQQSRELYEQLDREKSVANQWYNIADCYLGWGKYEQAIECERKDLELCQKLDDQSGVALAYYQFGRIYQDWGRYGEAIAHYQQSRDLYDQLGLEKDVANQWGWLADTYRDWGRYEQALDSVRQCLELRQQLENQPALAQAYYRFGRIYQAWSKYEEAIAHYQQSRDLYEQLCNEKSVTAQWYKLADCYRDWGKYEQAIECERKDLELCQKLDDQSEVALAYYQFGRIYQGWGKYEEAITHYQQSRDLYEQLGLEKDAANLFYKLSDCYRAWSKYEQAVKHQQQCLAIRQKLDNQTDVALSYYQLGRIYQGWGKYEEAITHYQQSRDLYEQLDREKSVANQSYNIADCYLDWGEYEQAVECELKDLEIRQKLDDQVNIADGKYKLGRIYQAWGKYEEAIAHYQQSRDLYEQLDLRQNVANLWSWLASCYRDLEDYSTAIDYYQQSRDLHQQLDQNESRAKRCRYMGNSQRLLAKNTANKSTALTLFTQAEQNIHQAIQINTENDYKKNLAYDHTALGLLYADRLRLWPFDGPSLQHHINQFHHHFNTGFEYFDQLGQTVNRAAEALDMARAYLEIEVLEDLERAEAIAQDALQTFRDCNRRKRQAAALKLLGEIYRQRTQRHQANAEATARQYLTDSLQLYRDLDLAKKVAEVGLLLD